MVGPRRPQEIFAKPYERLEFQIHYDGAKDSEAMLEIVGDGPATVAPAEAKYAALIVRILGRSAELSRPNGCRDYHHPARRSIIFTASRH
jgi:hypothetical protein